MTSDNNSEGHAKPLDALLQYINPGVHELARQAFQAHENELLGCAKMDTYKTVMCQTWLETASCGFGANCKFAHGPQELRYTRAPIRINRKYKTRLCEKYTVKGICPYGSRCLFIHPDPVQLPFNGSSNAGALLNGDVHAYSMVPYSPMPFQTSLPMLPMGCSLYQNSTASYPSSPMKLMDQVEGLRRFSHRSHYSQEPSSTQELKKSQPQMLVSKNLLPGVQQELRMEKRAERKQQIHDLLEKQQYPASADLPQRQQEEDTTGATTTASASTTTSSTGAIKQETPDSEDIETVANSLANVLDMSDLQL